MGSSRINMNKKFKLQIDGILDIWRQESKDNLNYYRRESRKSAFICPSALSAKDLSKTINKHIKQLEEIIK